MELKQALATAGLLLLSAVCAANPLDRAIVEVPETGRPASELFHFCDSADPDRLAYCEGYILGVAYMWKLQHVCASVRRVDQLLCAGVREARTSIRGTIDACADCDQLEGRRRLRDELRSAADICTTNEGRDEHYCAGYNAEIEITIAQLMLFQPVEAGQSAGEIGLSHGLSDIVLELWTSSEIHGFVPCLEWQVGPEQMRAVFLRFIQAHPEQQRDASAVIALEKALFYGLCPGPASNLVPHMEQCTAFEYDNGNVVVRNVCDQPVNVQFMEQGKSVIERQLAPGEVLVARRERGQGRWWMFATCPPGHVSALALSEENNDAIQRSVYSCVHR